MSDFSKTKSMFHMPEGVIYLDGNSLGPLPKHAKEKVSNCIQNEWGDMLIKGWNDANWMAKPTLIGNKIAKLIGADDGQVMVGDTLSIKVYQALASALKLNPSRKVILSDNGNFPTDLYMAQGLINHLDKDYELRVVDPEAVEENLTDEIAVMMITEVDYKTGRKHDMKHLTKVAHEKGILTIWDLAHSAGAVPVELKACDADFAVGCTYKYLNGGPGAPAFIYASDKYKDQLEPALAGWLGHDAPFAFDLDYRPAVGVERLRVGTPPVLQLTSLDAALDVWENVDMQDIRKKSIELCELFIKLVEEKCPMLELYSPRNAEERGSQVSFNFEHGYAGMQALIDHGVIGDFRAPNSMRFGFTPLYIDETDVKNAVDIMEKIFSEEIWKDEKYHKRNKVT